MGTTIITHFTYEGKKCMRVSSVVRLFCYFILVRKTINAIFKAF